MIMKYLTRTAIILSAAVLVGCAVSARGQSAVQEVCTQPFSYTFADFEFRSNEDLSSRALEFKTKLDELPESRGIVFVFGGKRGRLDEIREMIETVKHSFADSKFGYGEKLWIQDGGYRENTSIVFILAPLKCSGWSTPPADYRADEVEFAEFPVDKLVRSSPGELYRDRISAPGIECSPAGRAVRACIGGTEAEVYVIVNEKGFVEFSKCMSGHPLNRAKAEVGVRQWKFRPLVVNGKPSSRSGFVTVKFKAGPEAINY